MHSAPALLTLHILLVVAWLGVDVGVFTSSFVMRRPGLSTETRLTVRRLMRSLDLSPRISLILMIPVALALTHQTGWGLAGLPVSVLWVVALGALAWVGASVWSFLHTDVVGHAPAAARRIARADWTLRAAASAFFVVTGMASLVGDGPWAATWVAWKALLFGGIIAAGLWIRAAARRYHPALAELLEEGETPERLRRLDQDIRGVYPPVLLIWATLVAMVAIAVYRP